MIQVICGEVEEWFVYTTDNLLDGGANAIIEVLRQALFDLDRFVRTKYKCGIPKKGDLQYDNGSENKVLSLTKAVAINDSFCFVFKNKFMFAFVSYLIECGCFDKISINFLVAGHTHCEPDQVYSSYSYVLKRDSLFIATPLGLEYYLQEVGRASAPKEVVVDDQLSSDDDAEVLKHYRKAAVFRRIEVLYDIKTMLKPYLNNSLKYYQVPHCFV